MFVAYGPNLLRTRLKLLSNKERTIRYGLPHMRARYKRALYVLNRFILRMLLRVLPTREGGPRECAAGCPVTDGGYRNVARNKKGPLDAPAQAQQVNPPQSRTPCP
jgi:hypothetical protein